MPLPYQAHARLKARAVSLRTSWRPAQYGEIWRSCSNRATLQCSSPCRSLNMMDETYLMDMVKEQLCFVSQDVKSDLRAAQVRLVYFDTTISTDHFIGNFLL